MGGPGASLVARLLPDNVGRAIVSVGTSAGELTPRVQSLLGQIGNPVSIGEEHAGDSFSVLTGSGYLRLNPTVVTVRIAPAARGGSVLSVRAVAKEGLIKQRGGEQVAAEVAQLLRQLDTPTDVTPTNT